MSSYFNSLSSQQKANIDYLQKRMVEKGITNPYAQAAILAVTSKESSFVPKNETSYANTDNTRIRQIFGTRLSKYNDTQLTALKKDDKKFFDAVYGGMYGNAPDEGYKFRGRGFNQLTFKGNYQKIGSLIGVDLVSSPEKINDLKVASDAIIMYFIDRWKSMPSELRYKYGNSLNDFKDINTALIAVYRANAGWGKSESAVLADPTGGLKKSKDRVLGFYEIVKKKATDIINSTGSNTLLAIAGIVIVVGVYFIYKNYTA